VLIGHWEQKEDHPSIKNKHDLYFARQKGCAGVYEKLLRSDTYEHGDPITDHFKNTKGVRRGGSCLKS
jgi:hypothetical protein